MFFSGKSLKTGKSDFGVCGRTGDCLLSKYFKCRYYLNFSFLQTKRNVKLILASYDFTNMT